MKIEVEVHIHDASVSEDIFKSLAQLSKQQGNTMTAISDFAVAQAAHNARLEASLTGIGDDIAALNAKIAELQATPGAITPEDQALLDDLQAKGEALATRFEEADALTPPAVPVDPANPNP
jgi:peptidoglycan hydrolase CwlO-like protein